MVKVQLLMVTMQLLIQNTCFFNKLILNDTKVNDYAVNVNYEGSIVNDYNAIVNTKYAFFNNLIPNDAKVNGYAVNIYG